MCASVGEISTVREWFRTYKTHEGKPLNNFGLDDKAMDSAYACDVIDETHRMWKDLMAGHVNPNGLDLTR